MAKAKKKTARKTTKKKTGRKTAQLAVQLYTLREHLQTPRKIASTLEKVAKIGYRNVQISGVGPCDPLDLRKMIEDAGLTAIGAHCGLQELRDDFGKVVDTHHAWGVTYTAIAYLTLEERKTAAMWAARAREFTTFGKALAAEGITLQYHNHAFEFEKFGGRKGIGGKVGLEILYEKSDPTFLQAEIDTCWVARGGGDPADWCRRMKGRMHQVHLKDMVILDGEPAFAEIGEGNLNWDAILKACKAAGVRDYIVEQDSCPVTKNPFKSLEISYKNLRKMGLK